MRFYSSCCVTLPTHRPLAPQLSSTKIESRKLLPNVINCRNVPHLSGPGFWAFIRISVLGPYAASMYIELGLFLRTNKELQFIKSMPSALGSVFAYLILRSEGFNVRQLLARRAAPSPACPQVAMYQAPEREDTRWPLPIHKIQTAPR